MVVLCSSCAINCTGASLDYSRVLLMSNSRNVVDAGSCGERINGVLTWRILNSHLIADSHAHSTTHFDRVFDARSFVWCFELATSQRVFDIKFRANILRIVFVCVIQ